MRLSLSQNLKGNGVYVPDIEELYITDRELELAKKQIERIAFMKWQDAGCPEGQSERFWKDAELEWIEYYYVPDRYATEAELHALPAR